MADAQNRTLPATARRRQRARAEGQVARSRDLAHAVALGGGGLLLAAAGPLLWAWAQRLLQSGLRFDAQRLAQADAMTGHLADLGLRLLVVTLPVGAATVALAVLAAVASGGWNFTWQPLAPNVGKLNPLSGLGRLFSREHLLDTLKVVALATALCCAGALWLRAHLGEFHATLAMGLPQALAHTGRTLAAGFGLLLLCLAAFALLDLPLQRWNLSQRLRMSREEVRQEMKEMEGNAEVKGRIKARMREASRRRMLAAVPGADLVVMNPSHYAVALKYDEARGGAPRVVAKGLDLLALKIRDVAREARVPVLQAPPLARALYTHTELDQEIPAALFAAVAQVLAHVFALRAALAGRGAMPEALPDIAVPPGLDPLGEPA